MWEEGEGLTVMTGNALVSFLVLSRGLGGNESGSSFPFSFSFSFCSSSIDSESKRSGPEAED